MKELEATGQWTLADGTSSRDLVPKKQKIKRGQYLQKRVIANNPDDNDKLLPEMKRQKTQ